MSYPFGQSGQVQQVLDWGTIHQERLSPAGTMFCVTGRRIFVIGDIDGRFRPRSNPYDLYAFGRPDPQDPLANKLQGVWAQPVKGLAGYGYTINFSGETWKLEDAARFTQSFACAGFDYQRGQIRALRRDFCAQDAPVLFSTLAVSNQGSKPIDVQVVFTAEFDLEDAWFTKMARGRNRGETVTVEEGRLVARSKVLPNRWSVAVGGVRPVDARPPDSLRLLEGSAGELVYHLRLESGADETLAFGMAIDSQAGAAGALEMLDQNLPRQNVVLAENQALFAGIFTRGPHLCSPDRALNAAFDLARANLQCLEAQSPPLGQYFYAGLEMFPFWFSNDGAYSSVGLLAGGLGAAALNHIRIGARFMPDGRVPHQISPSGRVAFAGNAQETPLWVLSVWDAYRWTGDRAFLAEMYPHALRGMFEYVLGTIDGDGDGYPSGPGMVEMSGMGEEKLDSAAYTWAALRALACMADALGDAASARQARERADGIAARFDADWWDARGGTYAMSLENPGNRLHPVPHWAVIVPLEVGLATQEHAARTFATLRAQYLNRWGLKHTAGEDERVWTLPTATLSRAAYRYGERELGFEMLRHAAETLEAGSIGLFHELIPEGACFIQLWSAATFIRGVIEDLLGITVDAAEHRVSLAPQLPAGWDAAALDGLVFGDHRVSVLVEGSHVTVEHHQGQEPITIQIAGQEIVILPGKTRSIE